MRREDDIKGRVALAEQMVRALELLSETAGGLPQGKFVDVFGGGREQASRLLAALETSGLAGRDAAGLLIPGPVAVGLACRLKHHSGVIGHARPVLEALARRHGEAVCLSVLQGDEVIFVDQAETAPPETVPFYVGRRFPSLATAAGKAIRAVQSRDLLVRLFGPRQRGRMLELERVAAELDAIRRRGVAVDVGTPEAGLNSVAAAVRDYSGKVVCAVTLLGPSVRMLAARMEEEIAPSLVEAAEQLSLKLGFAKLPSR